MTERLEWLRKYAARDDVVARAIDGHAVDNDDLLPRYVAAAVVEIAVLADRIARLEAGQRELEARLGDGE